VRRALVDVTFVLVAVLPLLVLALIVWVNMTTVGEVLRELSNKLNEIVVVHGNCQVSIVRQT